MAETSVNCVRTISNSPISCVFDAMRAVCGHCNVLRWCCGDLRRPVCGSRCGCVAMCVNGLKSDGCALIFNAMACWLYCYSMEWGFCCGIFNEMWVLLKAVNCGMR